MAKVSKEQRVVAQIIKEHGDRLDLRASPDVLIEIIRKYAVDVFADPDGGLPPGGVGPVGPTSLQAGPQIEDLMKEVLKIRRDLAKLSKRFVD